ncbi:MAG: glycoside hydrolase, partial [Caulobacteraceae bacterium]
MKRLAALLALTGAFAVAACDDPRPSDEGSLADKAAEQPLAPAAEDVGVPAETVAPTPPPAT